MAAHAGKNSIYSFLVGVETGTTTTEIIVVIP